MREEVVSCFMKKEVDQSISIKTLSRQPPFLFRNNTYQKKFTYGATSNLHPMIPQRCKCSNPTPKKTCFWFVHSVPETRIYKKYDLHPVYYTRKSSHCCVPEEDCKALRPSSRQQRVVSSKMAADK